MIYNEIVRGRYCDLKSAAIEDAEFTLNIRRDPSLTEYLPKLDITLEQQMEWIKKQQQEPTDYFFVVWDKNGKRIGTMGVYNIEGTVCETGRLAIKGNPLQVIEAQMLFANFVFDTLNISLIRSYILAGNERAVRNVKIYGARVSKAHLDEEGRMVYSVEISRDSFHAQLPDLERMIYRQKNSQ